MKLSAVIIARDEEAKIGTAIKSVLFADEVLLVDSGSTDKTRDIAVALGARVIELPWNGFAKQKQIATDLAANDWILSIDADEEISAELAAEIRGRLSDDTYFSAFRIPRKNIYLGKFIRFSGWYPDWQTRLFDRRKGEWLDRVVHESFKVSDGNVGSLQNPMIHRSIDSLEDHRHMIRDRYAPLGASEMQRQGRRTTLLHAIVAGPATFLGLFVLRLGFLDGFRGLAIAYFSAYHNVLKHLHLRILRKQKLP